VKQKYLILFSLSGFLISVDQFLKHWVVARFAEGQGASLFQGLMVRHLKSNGFAFGLFQKMSDSLQDIFIIGVPIFALILIVLIFIKLRDDQMVTSVALSTILGGAVSNLIDRLQYGFVIDFLELSLGAKLSPVAFNIADFAIIIGVLLVFVGTLKAKQDGTDSVGAIP